jgi:hypothetical protein
MTKTPHRIFYATLDDGSVIAVSIDSPRFCVGAPTKDEAFAKADRAIKYSHSVEGKYSTRSRQPRVIKPAFQEEELCA